MKKYFKVVAVLFAFVMQSASMCAQGTYPVDLEPTSSKVDPTLNGMPLPSRAPAKHNKLLMAFIDECNQQLIFSDYSGELFIYNVYSESGSLVSQGLLDFSNSDIFFVDLYPCQAGQYSITVIQLSNNKRYIGVFDIE